MVKIKSICRQCFAANGFSNEIMFDPSGDIYVCTQNPKHKYKKEEDGTFSSL
jgi:ribosomal protein L36